MMVMIVLDYLNDDENDERIVSSKNSISMFNISSEKMIGIVHWLGVREKNRFVRIRFY